LKKSQAAFGNGGRFFKKKLFGKSYDFKSHSFSNSAMDFGLKELETDYHKRKSHTLSR
jgi:hypothetical protein